MTQSSDDVELLYNPLDAGFRADPYATYRRLRDDAPVHLSPLGFWVVSRYADCVRLLRAPEASTDYRSLADSIERPPDTANPSSLKDLDVLLFLDPPDHTRVRGLLAEAFAAASVRRLTDYVRTAIDTLVRRLNDQEQLDFIGEFAYPVPVDAICHIIGLPTIDFAQVRAWSGALVRSLDPDFTLTAAALDEARVAIADLCSYFDAEATARATAPRSGLLSELVAAEKDGQLTRGELVNNCVLLLAAGHETTANLLGNGLLALLRNPEQATQLAADPVAVPTAVDEMLRYDSPIQATKRIPLVDLELEGATIATGSMVVLLLGAANRDPAMFARPDSFDVTRAPNPHLAFSNGPHYCIGARLAHLEAQLAFEQLAPLLPRLGLAHEPRFKESVVIRGLERLDVAVA